MGESDPISRVSGEHAVCKSLLRDVRVLVVDDIAENTEVVDILLTMHGALVTVADSVETGMLAMDEEGFDVVVSDIAMPKADGFEFLRRIREREGDGAKQIPVIALTGQSSQQDQAATAQAGFHAHLCKPIEPQKLVALIASVLGRC